MRFATSDGRVKLVRGERMIDIAEASRGALPSDPLLAFDRWAEVVSWAGELVADAESSPLVPQNLDAPSPTARQAFAIGLNYAPHARESGFSLPKHPFVFTKTTASYGGPFGELVLPSSTIDWEVEIVVVIGKAADHVSRDTAWDHVAGLTVGQDYSDREVQNRLGPNTQPGLAKSRPGFGPTGPFLVTIDEFDDPGDIGLSTTINGAVMQQSTSADMVFGIPALIEYLSNVVPLLPGDLIFTGTPEGVGMGRNPQIYLAPGDVVETFAAGIGTMRHVAVAPGTEAIGPR